MITLLFKVINVYDELIKSNEFMWNFNKWFLNTDINCIQSNDR